MKKFVLALLTVVLLFTVPAIATATVAETDIGSVKITEEVKSGFIHFDYTASSTDLSFCHRTDMISLFCEAMTVRLLSTELICPLNKNNILCVLAKQNFRGLFYKDKIPKYNITTFNNSFT